MVNYLQIWQFKVASVCDLGLLGNWNKLNWVSPHEVVIKISAQAMGLKP